jgi:hypothetical protein
LPDPVHPFTVSFGTFASGETVNIRGFPRCVYRVGTRVATNTSVSAPSVNQILFCMVPNFTLTHSLKQQLRGLSSVWAEDLFEDFSCAWLNVVQRLIHAA